MNQRTRAIAATVIAATLTAAAFGAATIAAGSESRATDFDIPRSQADAALAQVRDHAPGLLKKVLDGGVSLDEYRSAVQRSASCYSEGVTALAAEHGLVVPVTEGKIESTADQYRLSTTYAIDLRGVNASQLPPDALDQTSAIEARCTTAELEPVERAYQIERKSDPDFTAKVAQGAIVCLRKAGMPNADLAPESLRSSVRKNLVATKGRPDTSVTDCLDRFPALTEDPLVIPVPPK